MPSLQDRETTRDQVKEDGQEVRRVFELWFGVQSLGAVAAEGRGEGVPQGLHTLLMAGRLRGVREIPAEALRQS